jgi:hypothetical protein
MMPGPRPRESLWLGHAATQRRTVEEMVPLHITIETLRNINNILTNTQFLLASAHPVRRGISAHAFPARGSNGLTLPSVANDLPAKFKISE